MFNFQRKNTEFFDHFVESAKCFYRGSLILDEVMLDYTRAADKMKEIIDLEHEADAVNDQIIDELKQTVLMTALIFCRRRCSGLLFIGRAQRKRASFR